VQRGGRGGVRAATRVMAAKVTSSAMMQQREGTGSVQAAAQRTGGRRALAMTGTGRAERPSAVWQAQLRADAMLVQSSPWRVEEEHRAALARMPDRAGNGRGQG